MRSKIALPFLILALAGPAAAQAPAEPVIDLGSAVVEALEVVAPPPGPPLWRVSRGQSEVIILGAVKPLPHLLAWDSRRVERALTGAKALLLEPEPKLSFLDAAGLTLGGKSRFKTDAAFETTLPGTLRRRFVAAREAARQKPDRYDKWKPQIAAVMLVADFREAAGLSNAKPGSTLIKLARAQGVPVRTAGGSIRLVSVARQAAQLDPRAAIACVEDAVAQVESEASGAQALARAWAAGDLRGVRALYSPPALQRCAEQAPGVAALIERGTTEGVNAIMAALATPGRTVAVVDLNYLLRPNGVLDRLKARGAEVTAPTEF